MICRTRVLTAVLAVLVVLGATVSGAAGQASAATAESGSASFADRAIEVTRGDTLEITVSHSETARLNLGSRESGFLLTVTLPGSGTHTVTIDTYNSTGHPRTYVSGGGNVTLRTPELTRPLATGTYLMNVTVDGVERDIGRFVIHERGPMNATTAVAPGSLLDGDAGLTPGAALGAATPGTAVAKGDLAVIRVNETGLENAFDPAHLSGDAASNGIDVRFTERDPPPNLPAISFTASTESVRVLTDFEHDQLVFVWNTSAATARLPDGVSNHTYDVTFRLDSAENGLVSEDTVAARTQVDLVPARVSVESPSGFTVPPWADRTLAVTGRTTLAPGTTLDVRARSASKTQPFLQSHTARVDANGTFAATFDFSAVARGASFPLWVRGYRDGARTVTLQAEHATLNFSNQERTDESVLVRNVSLAAGGFVAVTANDTALGVSPYLSPGAHRNVTVSLTNPPAQSTELTAVAFMDRDGSRAFNASADEPYAQNDTRVASSAIIWTEDSLRTTTPAASTPSPTTTPATTPTTTTLDVQPETPLEPVAATGAPLNPVLAVFALLAAGLLARRH